MYSLFLSPSNLNMSSWLSSHNVLDFLEESHICPNGDLVTPDCFDLINAASIYSLSSTRVPSIIVNTSHCHPEISFVWASNMGVCNEKKAYLGPIL